MVNNDEHETKKAELLAKLTGPTPKQKAEQAEIKACNEYFERFNVYPTAPYERYRDTGYWFCPANPEADAAWAEKRATGDVIARTPEYIERWYEVGDERLAYEFALELLDRRNLTDEDGKEYTWITNARKTVQAYRAAHPEIAEQEAEAERQEAKDGALDGLFTLRGHRSIKRVDPPSMLTGEGIALMYPGKNHLVYAPRNTGKTTLATLAAAQEIRAGNYVVWLDYENQYDQITERLEVLGIDPDDILTHLLHFDSPHLGMVEDITELAAEFNKGDGSKITLCVADAARGLAEALAPGVRDSLGHDVGGVEKILVNPLRSTGTAIMILTHESGGSAFGSQHWESFADVVLSMTPGQEFNRDDNGYSHVSLERDRLGYLKAGELGHLMVWDCKPELVQPGRPVQPREATGKGTGRCECGNGIDRRAERCKACSNKLITEKREQARNAA